MSFAMVSSVPSSLSMENLVNQIMKTAVPAKSHFSLLCVTCLLGGSGTLAKYRDKIQLSHCCQQCILC